MIEKNRGNNNGIPLSGIGYVVIPEGCNVAEYIKNCYRNSSISISGGYGCTYMHNVRVTIDALNNIRFPIKNDELGSPVVWIRDSFTNRAVVIGVLTAGGKSNLTGIFQQRIYQEVAAQIAEIFLDAMNSRLVITALGNDNVPGEVVIKASSGNAEGDAVKLFSKDIIELEGKRLKLLFTDNFDVLINDGEKDILSIKGNPELFELKDQFGNFINFNEESVELKDQFENSILMNEDNVKISAKKVNVGDGNEQMVLGNTLVSLLEELISAINSLTVLTPHGPSGTPINAAQFTKIKSKLKTMLSDLSNTD
jgi:hypothetical protein